MLQLTLQSGHYFFLWSCPFNKPNLRFLLITYGTIQATPTLIKPTAPRALSQFGKMTPDQPNSHSTSVRSAEYNTCPPSLLRLIFQYVFISTSKINPQTPPNHNVTKLFRVRSKSIASAETSLRHLVKFSN